MRTSSQVCVFLGKFSQFLFNTSHAKQIEKLLNLWMQNVHFDIRAQDTQDRFGVQRWRVSPPRRTSGIQRVPNTFPDVGETVGASA